MSSNQNEEVGHVTAQNFTFAYRITRDIVIYSTYIFQRRSRSRIYITNNPARPFPLFSFPGGVARAQQNVDPLRAHHGDPCRGGGPGIGGHPRLRVHGKRDGPSPSSRRVPPRRRGPPHRASSRPPRNDVRAIRLQAGRHQGREDRPQVPSLNLRSVSVLRPLLPSPFLYKSRRRWPRGQTGGTLSHYDRALGRNRGRNQTAS